MLRRPSRSSLALAATLSVVLLGTESTVFADDLKLELGGFVGWHFFSDKSALGRTVENDAQGFNDFLVFGPRIGLGSRLVVGELELGIIPTKTHAGDAKLWIDAVRVAVRRNFLTDPGSVLHPFVLLGVGYASVLDSSNTAVVTETRTALLQGGGGLIYDIRPKLSARLDVRAFMESGLGSHDVAWDFETLLGLFTTFDLGGGAAPAAAVVADRDSDGDGIMDSADRCPTQPETRNGFEDGDGCPDGLPAALQKFTGKIAGIEFETGSATIRSSSHPTLDAAVQVLKDYPAVRLVVEGHTDNVGTRELNLELSKRRAESVRDYMVGKGIAGERLTAEGFGPDRPIADNTTDAGRADNRRVEFRLLSQ